MVARALDSLGLTEPTPTWLVTLARAARRRHADGPPLDARDELAWFLARHDRFGWQARRAGVARDFDRLKAILTNCIRHGPDSQNRDGHPDLRAHLRGKIAWVEGIDARRGARLRSLFDRVAWEPEPAS
jgi:hypothetical protein